VTSWPPVSAAADTAVGAADGAAEDVVAGVSGAAVDAEVVCPCATGAFAAPAAAHPQTPRTAAARPATPARTRNPSHLRPAVPARAPSRVTTDHGTARTSPSGAYLAPVTGQGRDHCRQRAEIPDRCQYGQDTGTAGDDTDPPLRAGDAFTAGPMGLFRAQRTGPDGSAQTEPGPAGGLTRWSRSNLRGDEQVLDVGCGRDAARPPRPGSWYGSEGSRQRMHEQLPNVP